MAAQSLKRTYPGKDVDMLTACATIIEQAIIHKTFLISKRANWADPFLPNLKTRIATAFTDLLGIDNAKELREATQIVIAIQQNALPALAEFKVQIMEDFKNNKPRRDEILNRLGFTQHLKDAQNNDQEALIELLLKFKKNMNPPLQTEITTAGMSLPLITAIISYADALKNADITQETLKGSRKVISQTAVTEFNAIYEAVISIAKISAKFFIDDLAIRDKFSYSKTLSNINQPTGPAPPLFQATVKINGLNLLVQTDINGNYDFLQPISPAHIPSSAQKPASKTKQPHPSPSPQDNCSPKTFNSISPFPLHRPHRNKCVNLHKTSKFPIIKGRERGLLETRLVPLENHLDVSETNFKVLEPNLESALDNLSFPLKTHPILKHGTSSSKPARSNTFRKLLQGKFILLFA